MKIKNILGIILVVLGVVLAVLSIFAPIGEGTGYLMIWFAIPLFILGLLLLVSIVGAGIFLSGEIVLLLTILTQPTFNKSTVDLVTSLIFISYGLFVAGILYGIVEGIIKLIKIIKK